VRGGLSARGFAARRQDQDISLCEQFVLDEKRQGVAISLASCVVRSLLVSEGLERHRKLIGSRLWKQRVEAQRDSVTDLVGADLDCLDPQLVEALEPVDCRQDPDRETLVRSALSEPSGSASTLRRRLDPGTCRSGSSRPRDLPARADLVAGRACGTPRERSQCPEESAPARSRRRERASRSPQMRRGSRGMGPQWACLSP